MDGDSYDVLVEAIYDAALDPERWGIAVSGLKDAFNSIAAGFFVQTADQKLNGSFFQGLDNDEMEIYGAHFASNNPWFTIPGLMKPGRVLTDLSLEKIHSDRRAFLKTEMYQDWCKKQVFRHSMGGSLLDRHGNLLNFTFFRSEQAGYYTDAEIKRYQALCRHLMKAVEINARTMGLVPGAGSQEGALDCLRLGVVTLDGFGRIVFVNKYADALLKSNKGLCEKELRLKTVDHSSQKLLDQALDQALNARKSATLTLPQSAASGLSLCVMPVSDKRDFLGMPSRSVTIFISDPDDREVANVDCLAKRWQLSPLEAQFALQLLKGLNVKEIAVALELTYNTAQWYCKQIMQKMGVKRQSELILKLTNDLSFFLDSSSVSRGG